MPWSTSLFSKRFPIIGTHFKMFVSDVWKLTVFVALVKTTADIISIYHGCEVWIGVDFSIDILHP